MDGFELERTRFSTSSNGERQSIGEKPVTDVAAGPIHTNLDRAIEAFDDETLPPLPDDERIIAKLMKNARILMEAGESRLAFNILRNVLIRRPDHPEALRDMGTSLREAGRYDEALKCFRALFKVTHDIEAQLQVAGTLYLCERDEMALAAYRDVMKRGVADAKALFEIYKNVGNIHVRAGDFDSAEEYYDKAYTISPESDVLLVNYGTLEIQRGQWDAAVERFRQAVAANPENDRAWVGLAMVHRTMGDLELAKGNIERALDVNPANRTALKLVVEWSIQDYDPSPALRRLETYVSSAQGGEDAEICFIFAKLLVQAGRLSQARIELERVLALDPGIEGGDALARVLDRELIRLQETSNEATESV